MSIKLLKYIVYVYTNMLYNIQ